MNCRHGIDTTADYCANCAVSDMNDQLRDCHDELAALRSRVEELQEENEMLTKQNEILRQPTKLSESIKRAAYERVLDVLADLSTKQVLQVHRKGIIKAMTAVRKEMGGV